MSKVHILFIRPTLASGGADKVTITLLQQFDRSKYEVELCLMQASGVLIDKVPKDVKVTTIGVSSIWKTVPFFVQLYKQNFDYLYATSSGISVPLLVAKWLSRGKIKTVISERTSFVRKKKGSAKDKLLFYLKKKLIKQADIVTVVSQSIATELITHTNVDSKKIRLVYNPIVPNNLKELVHVSISTSLLGDGIPVILSIGRLEKVKNLDLLFDALPSLDTKDFKVIILGEGSLQSHFAERIKRENLNDKVFLMGYQDNIYPYLNRADVFVLTSNFEGMPGALIQALATGTCCISTDCPTGPAELIDSGSNGLLIPKGDAKALAASIDRVLSQPELHKKMSNNGPLVVRKYQTAEAVSSYFDFL